MADTVQFSRALDIDWTFLQLTASAPLSHVASSFVANVNRTMAIASFPMTLFNVARVNQISFTEACIKLFGTGGIPVGQEHRRKEAQSYCDFLQTNRPANVTESLKLESIRMIDEAMGLPAATKTAAEAKHTLAGILTGIWTAFEVLAGDLWEAAINAHPQSLASLSGAAKRIERLAATGLGRSDSTELPDDARDLRKITLDEIRRVSNGSYNLSAQMGTLLRRGQKFTTLTGIRRAYSSAFTKRHKRIDDV